MKVEMTTQEEFRVLPCRVKIQGLALTGCGLAMALLKTLFCE
jgi:hypothetical protein